VTAQDALARHRMTRAQEALQEADLLAGQGHYNTALNRAYYAAFYAARAILALNRLDSSRHSEVIALIQKHFVSSGIISDDVAGVLPQAFARRQVTDYGDFAQATAEEVTKLREEVVRFLSACERVLAES
jgi:uncharacterized protein (UPF0332 family)